MTNKKTYIEELLEENGLMIITREHYEWLMEELYKTHFNNEKYQEINELY